MLRIFAILLALTCAASGQVPMTGAGTGTPGAAAVTVCGSGWTGPTTGLTHCWPLDNAHVSGTTINDAIGAITGTAGAGVTAGVGPSGLTGSARTYNGTTQPILLASNPMPAQPVTFATWVNHTNNSSNDGADQRWVCFNSAPDMVLANNANLGSVDLKILASAESSTATTFSSAAWHHYAVTWDGTTVLLYVDAVLTAHIGAGQNDGCDPSVWALGGRNATARLWAGSQATTVIYSRVLTSTEITQLFNAK